MATRGVRWRVFYILIFGLRFVKKKKIRVGCSSNLLLAPHLAIMPEIPAIAPLDPADKKKAAPMKRICVRCKERKSTIVLQTATFCLECFQFSFEGKIRQNLEQSRLCIYLHRNEIAESLGQAKIDVPTSSSALYPCEGKVMIGFSGGVASRTLLHIAKARLLATQHDLRNGKRQEVQAIHVVYVDTSAIMPDTQDETERIRAIVQEEGSEAEGIHFWPLKLQDVFDDEQSVECTADSACESLYNKLHVS